jgi:hypothetical protein
MTHDAYEGTARCHDLPELERRDGPWSLLEIDADEVADAVAARRSEGGRLEEKVDGCWCAMRVADDGRLTDPRSRTDKVLRQAGRWRGVMVDRGLAGWLVIGEMFAGTSRARRARYRRGEELGPGHLDPFYVYSLRSPDGRTIAGTECAGIVGALNVERLLPVPSALPWGDWRQFTLDVLERGGEGVVIRHDDGTCHRAKARLEVDMVVLRRFAERDRRGRMRIKLDVGYCVSSGTRKRYRRTQTILAPGQDYLDSTGLNWGDFKPHAVVSVLGAMIGKGGIIRDARFSELRKDKPASECLAPVQRRAPRAA